MKKMKDKAPDAPAVMDEVANEEAGLEPVDSPSAHSPASQDEVAVLRAENADLRDQLLRKRAEFENYRKRVERDRQQFGIEVTATLLKGLIPAIDNLERALESESADSALKTGVELIRRDLIAFLEGQGVIRLDPQGQRFDPERHQALSHESVPGFDEGTVVAVFSKGYFYKDRLLRPALVKVAKAPDAASGSETVH